jgi:hypothetical protein
MWDFRWTNRYWSTFSPSSRTSVSTDNSHCRNCSIFTEHPITQRYPGSVPTASLNNQFKHTHTHFLSTTPECILCLHQVLAKTEGNRRTFSFTSMCWRVHLRQFYDRAPWVWIGVSDRGHDLPACEIWTGFLHQIINTDYRKQGHYPRWK